MPDGKDTKDEKKPDTSVAVFRYRGENVTPMRTHLKPIYVQTTRDTEPPAIFKKTFRDLRALISFLNYPNTDHDEKTSSEQVIKLLKQAAEQGKTSSLFSNILFTFLKNNSLEHPEIVRYLVLESEYYSKFFGLEHVCEIARWNPILLKHEIFQEAVPKLITSKDQLAEFAKQIYAEEELHAYQTAAIRYLLWLFPVLNHWMLETDLHSLATVKQRRTLIAEGVKWPSNFDPSNIISRILEYEFEYHDPKRERDIFPASWLTFTPNHHLVYTPAESAITEITLHKDEQSSYIGFDFRLDEGAYKPFKEKLEQNKSSGIKIIFPEDKTQDEKNSVDIETRIEKRFDDVQYPHIYLNSIKGMQLALDIATKLKLLSKPWQDFLNRYIQHLASSKGNFWDNVFEIQQYEEVLKDLSLFKKISISKNSITLRFFNEYFLTTHIENGVAYYTRNPPVILSNYVTGLKILNKMGIITLEIKKREPSFCEPNPNIDISVHYTRFDQDDIVKVTLQSKRGIRAGIELALQLKCFSEINSQLMCHITASMALDELNFSCTQLVLAAHLANVGSRSKNPIFRLLPEILSNMGHSLDEAHLDEKGFCNSMYFRAHVEGLLSKDELAARTKELRDYGKGFGLLKNNKPLAKTILGQINSRSSRCYISERYLRDLVESKTTPSQRDPANKNSSGFTRALLQLSPPIPTSPSQASLKCLSGTSSTSNSSSCPVSVALTQSSQLLTRNPTGNNSSTTTTTTTSSSSTAASKSAPKPP